MQKHKFNSEQTIEQKHMQRILFIKMVKRSKDIIWRYFDMDNTLMNDSETLLSKKVDYSENNEILTEIQTSMSDMIVSRGYNNKNEIPFLVDSHTKEVYRRIEIPNENADGGLNIKLNLDSTFISRCSPAEGLLNMNDDKIDNQTKIESIKGLTRRPFVYKKNGKDKIFVRCCPMGSLGNCDDGDIETAPMNWFPQLFIVEYGLKSDGLSTDYSINKMKISQFPVLEDTRAVEGAGFVTYFNKEKDRPSLIETYYFILGNRCEFQTRKNKGTLSPYELCNDYQKKTRIGLSSYQNIPGN